MLYCNCLNTCVCHIPDSRMDTVKQILSLNLMWGIPLWCLYWWMYLITTSNKCVNKFVEVMCSLFLWNSVHSLIGEGVDISWCEEISFNYRICISDIWTFRPLSYFKLQKINHSILDSCFLLLICNVLWQWF